MMSAATGIAPRDYAALFDTTYVSLYKYFGAPFGAVLCGSADFAAGLHHERRRFGGGLSAAYFAAALALEGTRGFEERFGQAMRKATELFERLNELPGISIETFEHGSNIFAVYLGEGGDASLLNVRLSERGVFIDTDDAWAGRFTITVNTTILRQSNDDIVDAFRAALA